MRIAPLVLVGLLFAPVAFAQETPKITLLVTVDQAMLLVQTLGAIGCQNVTQLMVCQQAAELLRDIREQAKLQVK